MNATLSTVQQVDVGIASNLSDLMRIGRALQFGASNANLWFRGQANFRWDLRPKLHRDYDAKAEGELIGEFKSSASVRFQKCPSDDAAWLCLMQHHGLPTRLLDWTKSLLIAAFFAVREDEYDCDAGAIWVTSQGILNYHMTGTSLSSVFSPSHLHSAHPVVAVAPAWIEQRMLLQQAAFTVHNDPIAMEKIPQAVVALHRIQIPADRKAHFRTELDCLAGINMASVFPELENLSAHLTKRTVRNMLSTRDKDFDINAINLFPTPCLPVDHPVIWGEPAKGPKIQSGCDQEQDLSCTCRSAATYTINAPISSIGARIEPLPYSGNLDIGEGAHITIAEGEFAGFSGIVEKIDSEASVVKVMIPLFGRESRISLKRTQMRARNLASMNYKRN